MVTNSLRAETFTELRNFVSSTICEYCQLQEGAFPMMERVLIRAGKPCGVYFCIHGPRATKFSAIWELENNQVLFYGCQGERYLKQPWGDDNSEMDTNILEEEVK